MEGKHEDKMKGKANMMYESYYDYIIYALLTFDDLSPNSGVSYFNSNGLIDCGCLCNLIFFWIYLREWKLKKNLRFIYQVL